MKKKGLESSNPLYINKSWRRRESNPRPRSGTQKVPQASLLDRISLPGRPSNKTSGSQPLKSRAPPAALWRASESAMALDPPTDPQVGGERAT